MPPPLSPTELRTLRREAASFLAKIQQSDGFERRRAELEPPPAALRLPWWSVRRLLREKPPPGTGVIGWAGPIDQPLGSVVNAQEVPKPSHQELEGYAWRIEEFAARYLAGPEWGQRALHDALRSQRPIALPRARPEPRVMAKPSELAELARAHGPKAAIRGNREKTWSAAVAEIDSRLRGQPARRRDALARARRYLNAAINRELADSTTPPDPLEPSDDPFYGQKAKARITRRNQAAEHDAAARAEGANEQ